MEIMDNQSIIGLVIRVTGGDVWVAIDDSVIRCLPRGRLRRGALAHLCAGDRVRVDLPARAGDLGAVGAIEPRTNYLARYVVRTHRVRMIVANVDRLFVVTSLRAPAVRFPFIDRVLASCEAGGVPASVVVNKMDLVSTRQVNALRTVYESCGYPVLTVSARTGDNADILAAHLTGGVYAFVGASGVGKTSLVNRLDPALDLPTRDVARRTSRGRHTTAYSQLFPFSGGYLADTPGMQVFGVPCATQEELVACFPEFARVDHECRFYECTHAHEPDCGVRCAVENGMIARPRYDSYLKILDEIKSRRPAKGQTDWER